MSPVYGKGEFMFWGNENSDFMFSDNEKSEFMFSKIEKKSEIHVFQKLKK